jgi:hypothetical protein
MGRGNPSVVYLKHAPCEEFTVIPGAQVIEAKGRN